jgi:hypothetical protein
VVCCIDAFVNHIVLGPILNVMVLSECFVHSYACFGMELLVGLRFSFGFGAVCWKLRQFILIHVGAVWELYPAFKKLESLFCHLFFLSKNGVWFHKRSMKSNDSRLSLSSDEFFGGELPTFRRNKDYAV